MNDNTTTAVAEATDARPALAQFARIPLALTELRRWVMWRYVERDGNRQSRHSR